MECELAKRDCAPCKGGTLPLKGDALVVLHQQLDGGWQVIEEHHLEKGFRFDTYQAAVDFTVGVASIAEAQNHHPDILLTWGKVRVTVWTHKVGGLTDNDFIFAAKVEEYARGRAKE